MKALIPLIAAVVVVSFFLGGVFNSKTVYIQEQPKTLSLESEFSSEIDVPAVTSDGKGVTTTIGAFSRCYTQGSLLVQA